MPAGVGSPTCAGTGARRRRSPWGLAGASPHTRGNERKPLASSRTRSQVSEAGDSRRQPGQPVGHRRLDQHERMRWWHTSAWRVIRIYSESVGLARRRVRPQSGPVLTEWRTVTATFLRSRPCTIRGHDQVRALRGPMAGVGATLGGGGSRAGMERVGVIQPRAIPVQRSGGPGCRTSRRALGGGGIERCERWEDSP